MRSKKENYNRYYQSLSMNIFQFAYRYLDKGQSRRTNSQTLSYMAMGSNCNFISAFYFRIEQGKGRSTRLLVNGITFWTKYAFNNTQQYAINPHCSYPEKNS